MKKVEIFSGNWTEIDVMKSSTKFFVFGDNCDRRGKGGQAIIRDLKNTIGLRTKKKPDNLSTSFFSDIEYQKNCELILEDVLNIKEKQLSDSAIVLSKNGYGTGLARLSDRSPQTFQYLNDCLKNFLHFDNINGTHYYRLPSGNQIASGVYVDLTTVKNPQSNSQFLESSLLSDAYTIYDQILKQTKISFTSDKSYQIGDIVNFYYPGKKEYLVCKVLNNSVEVRSLNKTLLSRFEGFTQDFVDNYTDSGLVTFIEFIATLDDKGNMVYNSLYFNDESEITVTKENKENLTIDEKLDLLNKKVDFLTELLMKKF
jgi:hypothetical protein